MWLWADAMIVAGAYYAVTGGAMIQFPLPISYNVGVNFAPLILFWALTGLGEIVDGTVNRRRGWGARLVSSLVTIIVFIGFDLILLWLVVHLEHAGSSETVVDPLMGIVIVPIAAIMVLAPLPAAAVNWYQAVARHVDNPRRTNMLLAVAAVHCLPLLWLSFLLAAPSAETIETRVVAGGVVVIGVVLARLLWAEGRERVDGGRHRSR